MNWGDGVISLEEAKRAHDVKYSIDRIAPLNIYVLDRISGYTWNDYYCFVVVAAYEDEARRIAQKENDGFNTSIKWGLDVWTNPNNSTCELIGVAIEGREKGIEASSNVGT